ncbi:SDR family oxidoreductase [candidate division KSB1 bacterium]|nr:SDR family oxidoreductase [candidate division KSB1 bacterium]
MKRAVFQKKVAIITGASGGIGASIAIALAKKGVNLVLTARNQNQLLKLTEILQKYEINTLAIPTDITQKEQVHQLMEETIKYFGKVDILIANAGQYLKRPILHLKANAIEESMAVNFYGNFHCIHEVLPIMLKQKTGHIIVVSAIDGKKGIPSNAAFATSKFALTGFVEVLRQEMRGKNIQITTIFPRRVDTQMMAKFKIPKTHPDQVARAIIKAIKKKKREILVPYWRLKIFFLLNTLSCRLGDRLVRWLKLEGKESSKK